MQEITGTPAGVKIIRKILWIPFRNAAALASREIFRIHPVDHDVIYNGSIDCKFVRKRGRVKPGMRNACLRSLQNLAGVLPGAFSLAFVCSASLPGRSFVLFRSVNVVSTYSLTVEQGSKLRLGFRANMRLGRCERRVLARSTDLGGKADFSYREIGSSKLSRRDSTRLEKQAFPLFTFASVFLV